MKTKILTLVYLLISSVTVLVMLTTSFELFNEKYLPSFMLAQKYALPIILSAMAAAYLTFFEPERLQDKRTMLGARIGFVVALGLFAYYLFRLDTTTISGMTLAVYWVQLFATTAATISLFFRQR